VEEWADKITARLVDLVRVVQRGLHLSSKTIAEIENRFDRLVQVGIHFHAQLDPCPNRVGATMTRS